MTYNFEFLSKDDAPIIYKAFMSAFSDYAQDVSHITETYFVNRATKNGVDYETSVGVYVEGEMVGFMVIGFDDFKGDYAAFDAFTGIVKPHRGQGLANKMFEFVLPKLKAKGVKKFYLEVLQENEPAVRAYQKTGFTITRELDAFAIDFNTSAFDIDLNHSVEIRKIGKTELTQAKDFLDWPPSWENSLSSIARIPDEVLILGAYIQDNLVGVLVHYPLLNWILNLAVHKSFRRINIGTALLAYLKDTIAQDFPITRIINIQHTDQGMLKFLESAGFEFFGNQYEMQLDL